MKNKTQRKPQSHVLIQRDTYRAFVDYCKRYGLSVSAHVRFALIDYINRNGAQLPLPIEKGEE